MRHRSTLLIFRGATAAALGAALLAGCDDGSGGSSSSKPRVSVAPWQRTETREACDGFDLFRQPYFGDLHIHTKYSADAYIFGTRGDARDAYAFARGAEIAVSDENEEQTRTVRIDRTLDFAAVTDHAEFLGEVELCSTPGSAVFDDELCQLLRQAEPPDRQFNATVRWLFPAGIANPPPSHAFCNLPGIDCDAAAVSVWKEIQAAAEEAYDRTRACAFTTFIGYEHTASPAGRHLHRNIIFRNHNVPELPASQLETAAGGIPQGTWAAIETDCLNAGTGCDAVIIPHNSNLSGGEQWLDPADAVEARRRQNLEPLAEMHQQKGNSECRFDRLAGAGAGTEDELCTFEQLPRPHELPGTPMPPIDEYPRRNMVRNALKDGLFFEATLGVNPFKLGFIGGTDTHNATGGNVDETEWEGGGGNNDASPALQIGDGLRSNPGGLAVVWAEENSRDAIFAALRRRETYATSGTRAVVRFFGGGLEGVDCARPDLIESFYRDGVPMGGDLGPVRGSASPRFAVLALQDPGSENTPPAGLQRVQIVKGWVDPAGATHERVFDVAGDSNGGPGVNPETCAPAAGGAPELCAVWEDPEFDRTQRAFYYARVLENPTCRWSTILCKREGVDPFSPDCAAQAAAAGEDFAACCLTAAADPFFEPAIQERAWTSPIWYRPENIARVEGRLQRSGDQATLDLSVYTGREPAAFDLGNEEFTIELHDAASIFRVVVPAGTLRRETEPNRWVLPPEISLAGLESLAFEAIADGGLLTLEASGVDVEAVAFSDHFVEVLLAAGMYEASLMQLWAGDGDRLTKVSP